ncbi:unnamed protein product [Amoebophrya sp. A120]|nr:unnamed protein product [Amoebophrya sp. A120]|eukprot:GSA120T00002308001.1
MALSSEDDESKRRKVVVEETPSTSCSPREQDHSTEQEGAKWKCGPTTSPSSCTTSRTKRHGFDWYENVLDSPRHICAPMVDQSELAFRLLCLDYGTDLCYTPMINSKMVLQSVDQGLYQNLVQHGSYSSEVEDLLLASSSYQAVARQYNPVFDSVVSPPGTSCTSRTMEASSIGTSDAAGGAAHLGTTMLNTTANTITNNSIGARAASTTTNGVVNKFLEREFSTSSRERNKVIAQFCGDTPSVVLAAARLVEPFVAGVDLNCGCPQGIAKKGHYGAYLLEEPDLICGVISTLAKNLKRVPATCKIRKVNNSNSYQETLNLCESLLHSGVSAITIHGRTKEEKGQHVKQVDWEAARLIKEKFRNRGDKVPIFSNGGIENYADVERCFEYTGCDAVMSSEALLEDPQLFAFRPTWTSCGTNGGVSTGGVKIHQRKPQDIIFEEYAHYAKQTDAKFKCVKAHCFHMLYAGLQTFPKLREKVGKSTSIDEMLDVVTRELRGERKKWETERQAAQALSAPQRRIVNLDANSRPIIAPRPEEQAHVSADAGHGSSITSDERLRNVDVLASASSSQDSLTEDKKVENEVQQQLRDIADDQINDFPNLGWYRRYRNPIGGKHKSMRDMN